MLQWALATYRATPSCVTGDTAFFLMTGRDPYLPIDTMQGIHGRRRDVNSTDKIDFVTTMDEIAAMAREAIVKTRIYEESI